MKKASLQTVKIYLLFTLSLFFGSCMGIQTKKIPSMKGSGNITTEKREITETFDKIHVSGIFNVTIEQASGYEITVEADDNILPYIATKITGNKLKIYFDNVSITNVKKADIYVKLPKISELETSASSTIKSEKSIDTNNLRLKTSGASDINLADVTANYVNIDSGSSSDIKIEKISAKSIEVSASSSSDISLIGKTANLFVRASSSADINAKKLIAENVEVSASSSATVSVYPSVSLKAKASSTADIYYYNKPRSIEKEISSSGSIRQR